MQRTFTYVTRSNQSLSANASRRHNLEHNVATAPHPRTYHERREVYTLAINTDNRRLSYGTRWCALHEARCVKRFLLPPPVLGHAPHWAWKHSMPHGTCHARTLAGCRSCRLWTGVCRYHLPHTAPLGISGLHPHPGTGTHPQRRIKNLLRAPVASSVSCFRW